MSIIFGCDLSANQSSALAGILSVLDKREQRFVVVTVRLAARKGCIDDVIEVYQERIKEEISYSDFVDTNYRCLELIHPGVGFNAFARRYQAVILSL